MKPALTRPLALSALGAAVLAPIAGCSSTPEPAPTVTVTATADPRPFRITDTSQFQSTEELAAAWEEASGRECIPHPDAGVGQLEHSSQLLFCDSGMYFTLYQSHEDLQKQLHIMDRLARDLKNRDSWVVGENWAIAGDPHFGDPPMGQSIELGWTP